MRREPDLPVVERISQDVTDGASVELGPGPHHCSEEGQSGARSEQGPCLAETPVKLRDGLVKTTFQLSQPGVVSQESLEPAQVVQQAGGEEGDGDLPGELRHHQDGPPASQLSALDDVGIEMVSAVEDLTTTTTASHQVAQVGGLAATEDRPSWDVLVRTNCRTECPASRLYQVEPGPAGEISGFAGVHNDPVKV